MSIKANIVIDKGCNFTTNLNITNDDEEVVDLTGYTGEAQIRKHYTSNTYYSFVVSLDEELGVVTLSMQANTSNTITAGRYVYDCALTSTDGTRTRVVEGIVTVTPSVTR